MGVVKPYQWCSRSHWHGENERRQKNPISRLLINTSHTRELAVPMDAPTTTDGSLLSKQHQQMALTCENFLKKIKLILPSHYSPASIRMEKQQSHGNKEVIKLSGYEEPSSRNDR